MQQNDALPLPLSFNSLLTGCIIELACGRMHDITLHLGDDLFPESDLQFAKISGASRCDRSNIDTGFKNPP